MSDKVRVYEIAEEAGANSTEVIAKAKDLGIDLKSPQSAVSFAEAEEITNYIMTGDSPRLKKQTPAKKTVKKEKPAEVKVEEKTEISVETKAETKKEEVIETKKEETTQTVEASSEERPKVKKVNNKIVPKEEV